MFCGTDVVMFSVFVSLDLCLALSAGGCYIETAGIIHPLWLFLAFYLTVVSIAKIMKRLW